MWIVESRGCAACLWSYFAYGLHQPRLNLWFVLLVCLVLLPVPLVGKILMDYIYSLYVLLQVLQHYGFFKLPHLKFWLRLQVGNCLVGLPAWSSWLLWLFWLHYRRLFQETPVLCDYAFQILLFGSPITSLVSVQVRQFLLLAPAASLLCWRPLLFLIAFIVFWDDLSEVSLWFEAISVWYSGVLWFFRPPFNSRLIFHLFFIFRITIFTLLVILGYFT